jgi:hypothetical protein
MRVMSLGLSLIALGTVALMTMVAFGPQIAASL